VKRGGGLGTDFFVRAPLHCVPARQNRACWEQLRASLRRSEMSFLTLLRHDSAALARYARAGLTAKVVRSAPEVAYLWLDRACGGSWLTHCPL